MIEQNGYVNKTSGDNDALNFYVTFSQTRYYWDWCNGLGDTSERSFQEVYQYNDRVVFTVQSSGLRPYLWIARGY